VKALLYTGPGCFEYTDFPDPQPGDDDVLVRVKACGICGSDVHGATGKTGRRLPPLIMGHEAAGTVEKTGPNVRTFQKGDRVTFDSTVYCSRCEQCRAGRVNRCEERQVLGVAPPQFKRHGAMAEYVAVPWWIVAPIPDNMSFVQAALLEPVSIGVHAAGRAPLCPDDTAVVIGTGTIGLFILQAVRLRGPAEIIACDIDDFRLGLARRLGADVTINPAKMDLACEILSRTGGKGAHVTYEAVGFESTFHDAIAVTRSGGHIVAVGNLTPEVRFNPQQLVARELTIVGSYASSGEFRDCIDLVASGKIDVEPLISDVLPLSEGASAFKRLLDGRENLLKIVLEP